MFMKILHNIYYPSFLSFNTYFGKRILETEARIRELNMRISHKDFWPYMWQI